MKPKDKPKSFSEIFFNAMRLRDRLKGNRGNGAIHTDDMSGQLDELMRDLNAAYWVTHKRAV